MMLWSVSLIGKVAVITSSSMCAVTGKPDASKTPIMLRLSAWVSAVNVVIPSGRAASARL